jgi:protein gp37
MHPAWVKLVRDQCDAAYVPFFFKQWGEWFPMGLLRANGRDLYLDLDGSTVAVNDYVEGKGKDPVRMVRIGKKTAGRHLQGCTHDSLPWGGAK